MSIRKFLLLLSAIICLCRADAPAQVTAAEYFFDTDPGIGNGAVLSLTAGDSVDILATIPTGPLQAGRHTVFTRYQYPNGTWTPASGKPFLVTATAAAPYDSLVAAELFIDTDPGFGIGLPIAITAGDSVEFLGGVLTNGLPEGLHRVGLRFQTLSGTWTSATLKSFLMEAHGPPEASAITNVVCVLHGLLVSGEMVDSTFDLSPDDGALDSTCESTSNYLLTAYEASEGILARGNYSAAVRVTDNLGEVFSSRATPFDVTSGLVIQPAHPTENDIFLHWYRSSQDQGTYFVYRGSAVYGLYSYVDSTSMSFYVDTVIPVAGTRFYRITARYFGESILVQGSDITPVDPAYRDD